MSDPSASSAEPLTVYSLCHHGAIVDYGLLCLGSFLEFCQEPVRMVLISDGSLTDDDKQTAHDRLGAEVLDPKEYEEQLVDELKDYPGLLAYRHEHVLSRKIVDLLGLAKGDFAFLDTDIRFFRPFTGIDLRNDPRWDLVITRNPTLAYSCDFRKSFLQGDPLKLIEFVNSGMFFCRRDAMDLDRLEWFVTQPENRCVERWIEQTAWGHLGAFCKSGFFDPNQIVVPNRRQEAMRLESLAVHYVSSTRGLLKSDQQLRQPEPNRKPERLNVRRVRATSRVSAIARRLYYKAMKKMGRQYFDKPGE